MRCVIVGLLLLLFHVLPAWGIGSVPEAPGLGDPGQLESLRIDSLKSEDGICVLAGRDARAQILVTGAYTSGQLRDLSRSVRYDVTPASVVHVDDTGYMTPIAEGTATVSGDRRRHYAFTSGSGDEPDWWIFPSTSPIKSSPCLRSTAATAVDVTENPVGKTDFDCRC